MEYKHMFSDIERGDPSDKFYLNNTPNQFAKRYNVYNEKDNGPYTEHMQSNLQSFTDSKDYSGIGITQNFNKNISEYDNQFSQWQKLKRMKENNKGRIIGYDLETIGDTTGYGINNSFITEIGITKTVLGNKQTNDSFSVAFGNNKTQIEEALALFKKAKDEGYKSLTSAEFSTIERYSRYGGRITDVYEQRKTISGIGENVTIVKALNDSMAFDIDTAYTGLINKAVLGGENEEEMQKLFRGIGLQGRYDSANALFKSAGLNTQNSGSDVFKKAISYIVMATQDKEDTVLAGFNINVFDNAIINKSIETNHIKLDNSNVIDVYFGSLMASGGNGSLQTSKIAEQQGLSNTTFQKSRSLEAHAKALGLEILDKAHNGGTDTYLTNQLLLVDDFVDGKSLIDAAEDSLNNTNGKYINSLISEFSLTGENKPVLFALNSILFNKNGKDSLRDGNDRFLSKYSDYGVNRGRYYQVNSIRDTGDGLSVEFETLGSMRKEDTRRFIKNYASKEELAYVFQNNFTYETTSKNAKVDLPYVSPEHILVQDINYNKDAARRNYENLFSIKSIELNSKNQYVGGYEKLNQFYKAYDQVAEVIIGKNKRKKNITEKDIADVSDGRHRDEIITALKGNDLYFDGKTIDDIQLADGQTNLRDFEAMFGKLYDEKEMFEYIDGQLKETGFNSYQKTLYANDMREAIISNVKKSNKGKVLSNIKDEESNVIEIDYSKANRQDLYNMEFSIGGKESLNVNFENIDNATRTMYNGFANITKDAPDKNVAMVDEILKTLESLHENKLIDLDVLNQFKESYGGTASTKNAWNLTNEIVHGIHTKYIRPLQDKGYSLAMLKGGDFSKLENQDLIDFVTKKAGLLGADVEFKSRTRFGANDKEVRSLRAVFPFYSRNSKKFLEKTSEEYLEKAGNISLNLKDRKDDIEDILRNKLHYDNDSVSRVDRMLNLYKAKTNEQWGLTTLQKNEQWKTDFVTQFYHSGNEGDKAFIMVNKREDIASREKIINIMSSDMTEKEKIEAIKEGKLAAIIDLPAINEDRNMLKNIDGMSEDRVYKTVGQGHSGFEKIVQERLSIYDKGNGSKLSDVDVTITNDGNELIKGYTIAHKAFVEDLYEGKEGYNKATARVKRVQDSVFSEMPGPSGIEAIPVLNADGSIKEWKKAIVPNFADMTQSAKIGIQPFQDILIRTAQETNDATMMNLLAQFSDKYEDGMQGTPEIMQALRDTLANRKSVSPEFDEYTYKHFVVGNFSDETNYTTEMKGGVLDYLYQKSVENPKLFSEKTNETIMNFWSNKDRISQIVKEHDASKHLISQVNSTLLNHLSIADSSNRPTIGQQLTARHYVKDIVEAELGLGTNVDRIERFGLTLGADVIPIQKEQILSNVKGKYGQYETTITGYVKQMDSTDIMAGYLKFGRDIKQTDMISELAKNISEYGIDSNDFDVNKLNAAFSLYKNELNNTHESKGFLRTSVANTTAFTAPDIKRVQINELSEYQIKNFDNDYIKNLRDKKTIHTGDIIGYVDDKANVVYHGPSGKILGDVDEFLKTGNGFIQEFEEGIHDNKIFIANEKMTMRVLEYLKSDKKFSMFKDKNELNAYTDIIMDKIFGRNVVAVANMEIGKHSSGSIPFGGPLNEIFRAFNKAVEDEKDFSGVKKRFSELISESDKGLKTGFKVLGLDNDKRLKGSPRHFTYNQDLMEDTGIHTQIENMVDIIKKNAKGGDSFWNKLWNNIKNNDKNNTALLPISRQIMGESMGNVVQLDARMAINLRTQFTEKPGMYNPDTGKTHGDVLYDYIVNESLNDKIKDSEVKNIGLKYKNAQDTIKGFHFSFMNMPKADDVTNMPNMLEVTLDDIIVASSGSSRSDMANHFLKEIDGDKVVYSELIKNIGAAKGIKEKDLNTINAVKINLTKKGSKGLSYELEDLDESGKIIKRKLTSVIMPVVDITPFKGDVYFTQTEILMNNVLRIAKDYADDGIDESQKELSKAANKYFLNIANEIAGSKDSYLNKKLMKIPMKNSAMFFAQSSIAPVVGSMVKNKSKWLNDENYRTALIKSVRDGVSDVELDGKKYRFDIDLYASKFNGKKYTKKINGKLLYENVTEISKEGFERMGVDFKTIGADIFFDKKSFKGLNKTDLEIAKGISSEKVLAVIGNKDKFDSMLKDFNTLLDIEKQAGRHKEGWVEATRKGLALELEMYPDDIKGFGKLLDNLSDLGQNYMRKEGVYGKLIRYPTFNEGSIRISKYRLNNSLGKNEIITTAAQGDRLKLDFDGDNLYTKLFLDNNKIMRKNHIAYKSAEILYNEQVSGNNEVLADMLQTQSDNIKKYGKAYDSISDITTGVKNVAYKAQLLNTLATQDDLEMIAQEKDVSFKSIDDLINNKKWKDIDSIFKGWDKQYGNLLRNPFMLFSAIKARATKGEVGYFSNVNYTLNQALYTSMDEAFQSGDMGRIRELQEIKMQLHSQNSGLLFKTEQTGIDVKHIKDGLTIAQTPQWMRGMQGLINGKNEVSQKKAVSKMLDSISGKLKGFDEKSNKEAMVAAIFNQKASIDVFGKDEKNIITQFRSLYKLSQDKTVREMFNSKIGKTIGSVLELNRFRANLDSLHKSVGSTEGSLRNAIKDSMDFVEFGFTDRDGFFHSIDKDPVYIGLSNNNGLKTSAGYRLNSFNIEEDETVKVMFDKINLDTLEVEEMALPFEGSIREVNQYMTETFGGFKEYSMPEIKRNLDLRDEIRQHTIKANTQNYADMMAKNINLDKSAQKKLKESFLNKSIYSDSTAEEILESKKMISAYNRKVDVDNFIDFRDKIRYIKSKGSKFYQNGVKDLDSAYEDHLSAINKQIIEEGLDKKTSTSVESIFDEHIKQLAKYPDIFDADFDDFKSSQSKLTQDIFDPLSNMIDLSKARISLDNIINNEELTPIIRNELASQATDIINRYKKTNETTRKSVWNNIETNTNMTSDLDELFGWNKKDMTNMRVGIGDNFGKRFGELSKEEIKAVIDYKSKNQKAFETHAERQTKAKLNEFRTTKKVGSIKNTMTGANYEDISKLTESMNRMVLDMGDVPVDEAISATKESVAGEVSKTVKRTLKESVFDTVNDMKKSTTGKVVLGLAALGIVSNLLNNDSQSPLSPEMKMSGKAPVGGGRSQTRQAPKSPSQKVVYADSKSGLHYKMSAKSKQKISQMDTGQMMSNQTNGNTDVNVYDDRSQVTNNWLERKFSEIV